jgi:preprotein translocase subunit SecG
MYYIVMLVHVVVCFFLIIVILLQSGKAADLAGAFGGMGSQTAFGPRGSATLLSKATTVSAVIFMITSLTLSILATRNAGLGATVLEEAPAQTAPSKNAPGKTAPAQSSPASPAGGKTFQIPLPPPSKDGSPVPVQIPPTPANPAPAKK